MNLRNTQKSEDEEGNELSSDLTKSLDFNFNKNQKAKAAKEKTDFKYQNFSEAVNFVKSFDNNNNNKTKKNLITKLNSENFKQENKLMNHNNPSGKGEIKICENKKSEKNFIQIKPESLVKQFNTDGKIRVKQSFKDFDLKENLLSKLENFEISEYSKTNAHFSREDEQKFYMKFEKNIEIKNNNVLTKSHGNKHFSMANGPYRMDIKPMLGKIKELQEYNFENNFNLKLNLNPNSNSCNSNIINSNNVNIFGNPKARLGKKNFESVNFEGLRNLNLEKIENMNHMENNHENALGGNKSVETINDIQNCMKVKAKYDTEKINVNDYYSKNKKAAVPAKSGLFENTKVSEAEFQRNLELIENQNQDLLGSLSLEEKSNSNLNDDSINNKVYKENNKKISDNNNNNDNNDKNYFLPQAEFKSVSKMPRESKSDENPNPMRNGGGASTGCKTLKTKIDSGSNSNQNTQNRNGNNNLNLNFKKSTIESKNSDSNISNGFTPINLNKNLENAACSKENSTENIFKDKDVELNVLKKEFKKSVSNGKSNPSKNVNYQTKINDKGNAQKIPSFNVNSDCNIRNNVIISKVDFESNDVLNMKDEEINFVKKPSNEGNQTSTSSNYIFNNNIINETTPKNFNSNVFTNANKNVKNTAPAVTNVNLHKRISSGLKVVSVEKQTSRKTNTIKNDNYSQNKIQNKNLSVNQTANSNSVPIQSQSAKPNQIIINEENQNCNDLLELVNGGGVSNGNFKVYDNPKQTDDSEPYPRLDENRKTENSIKASLLINQNVSINSAIKDQEFVEDIEQARNSSSSLLDIKINELQDVSKSQAIPLSLLKQKNLACNRQKSSNENNNKT